LAIIEAAARQSNIATDAYLQKRFVPFDPTTRRTEAILGAELQSVENKMREFAEKGYRTIAVATNRRKSHMELVGIVALYDMPRQDSARLIEELRGLGISVKMLTGDSLPIAKEIARQTELGNRVTNMSDLSETKKSDSKLAELTKQNDIFAEIYPVSYSKKPSIPKTDSWYDRRRRK
jgi:H+-transporting ATPase